MLAHKYPRYGFAKLFQVIRREGHGWNHKRVYRVYCAQKLNLRIKGKKRLPCRASQPLIVPGPANICWSVDFMSDALYRCQRFRIDAWRGYPEKLRLDNGPELVSVAMAQWNEEHGIGLGFIQPGKPTQN